MRRLSSVALEKTPRLRFAASCSAAEAMERPSINAPYFRTWTGAKQPPTVMAGLGPPIHVFLCPRIAKREWPACAGHDEGGMTRRLRFCRRDGLFLRHRGADAAARLLHRLDRRRRCTGHRDGDRAADLAV